MFNCHTVIKKAILAAVLVNIAGTGCGSKSKSVPEPLSKVRNVPGADPSIYLQLGQGLDSTKIKAKGTCVELGPLKTQSGHPEGQIAEFRMLEITSETALRSSLDISASASIKGFLGKGNGRMSYAESINKNSQSKYLMVHTRVANQIEGASSVRFNSEALQLITENRVKDFNEKCGDEFVVALRTGGEFFAVLEFDITSEQESKDFSAAISASGAAWEGSAKINTALAKLDKYSFVQVKMLKAGGDQEFPSIEGIKDFALKFGKMISNVGGTPVTLELITQDYSGVAPLTSRPNIPEVYNQLYVLGEIAQARDNAKETLNTIKYISQNERFYDVGGFDFEAAENTTREYLNSANAIAVKCYGNSSTCELPAAQPKIKLPQKKDPGVVWTRLNTPNWSFDYPADQGAFLDGNGGGGEAWIVSPDFSSKGDGEYNILKNQYAEISCERAFGYVKATGNIQAFYINSLFEASSATREYNSEFKKSQIDFAVRDISSNTCLYISFYNQLPISKGLSIKDSTETGRTIRQIIKSIRKK